jgi:hypothetical protein
LQDVLPFDEPVNTFTIRQHIAGVAKRLQPARLSLIVQAKLLNGTVTQSTDSDG